MDGQAKEEGLNGQMSTDKAEVIQMRLRNETPKPALSVIRKPILTQRQIDARPDGWEQNSESTNGLVARLLGKK